MKNDKYLNESSGSKVSIIDQYLQDNALHVVSAMGEGVALLDPDGRIRKVNPAFTALAECAADELEGRSIQQVLPAMFEENSAVIDETLGRVSLKQGAPDDEDALHLVTPKGTQRWLVPLLAPIESLEGTTLALVLTLRDITSRMQAQKERRDAERAYRERLQRLADRVATFKEQERRDVATQLHDTVIQSLSLCNIRLGLLREQVADAQSGSDLSREVDEIRRMLDAALMECRSMLAELTPPLLYELGLGPALNALAEKFERLHSASILVQEEACLKQVPSSLLGVLFEAIRELVVNAVKHAGDCVIQIHAERDGSHLVVKVCDDGVGFDEQVEEADLSNGINGFGLFNVRERLLHIGGALDICSAPGQGTTAMIRVPLLADE